MRNVTRLVNANLISINKIPVVSEKKLAYKERQKLPGASFVFPKERRYPIHDKAHARNALARVSAHGTPSEVKKVKAAVRSRYPDIKVNSKKN